MALGTLLARRVRRAGAAWLACLATGAAGCGGEVVNLGSSPLAGGGSAGSAGNAPGGTAAHIWELPSEPVFAPDVGFLLANPTLTAKEDELYYSEQQRGGSPEPNPVLIKHAQLSAAQWGNFTKLTLGDAGMPDASSPAISLDGTELWLGMNATGSTDIFRSVLQGGAWSTPAPVSELNSAFDDVPRQPGLHGSVMPLSSKRLGATPALYQIYFSTRDSADAPWSEPNKDLLGAVDSSAFQSADGFLTDNGLELYFSSTRDGDSDLYVARRASTDASFGEPEALADLNDPNGTATATQERMPWLSPKGDQLYFASDRTGQYALYVANKAR